MAKSEIYIDVIPVGEIETNCYLIGDDKEAILIDPGEDADKIIGAIKKRNAKVTNIVLTHGHADHIGAVPELKKYTGAPVLIHSEDAIMLTDAMANLSAVFDVPFVTTPADGLLKDGDLIVAGDIKLKVLFTPGHTPGGISLYEKDTGVVFTGDALFAGSIGRTDFPRASHEQLIEAIQEKLLKLPDETVVYPGHGPKSTIGNEKEENPWLT
jgi:glyoxylase-like metal-dependent hydrolase (beta-lactamase superfamily II)